MKVIVVALCIRVAGGCVGPSNVKIELSFIFLIFMFIFLHSLMLQNT